MTILEIAVEDPSAPFEFNRLGIPKAGSAEGRVSELDGCPGLGHSHPVGGLFSVR
jgi:hypothetical protein